jgi:F420-dependent methylenetetrahydromethanopterin dehydrogenase
VTSRVIKDLVQEEIDRILEEIDHLEEVEEAEVVVEDSKMMYYRSQLNI